jgi:hypothetical protein
MERDNWTGQNSRRVVEPLEEEDYYYYIIIVIIITKTEKMCL